MIDSILTCKMRPVYEAHRAVDLTLERAYRAAAAKGAGNFEASILLQLQNSNCSRCSDRLVLMGANPNEGEGGLRAQIAHAFAEHAEFTLDCLVSA
jgi:hypothetical protein